MLEGLLYINFAFNFRSPATDNEWARYKAGDAHVQDIHDVINSCAAHETKRHVAFWTQYLPHLYNSLSAPERTEQFTSSSGEGRLRGGVFALCGVSLVLLLLLCACAVLLRWQRAQRPDHPYDNH
ncbi:unnamed protein product [Plutella xylostella]|uniref:(diamondback moth) hypothetical protein n=1 Tax=Plutella xylostella TaxID=51655 RepID=A0A8S4EP72_PLUXY|nr:unnamed protein product [Plutella xylostella]